MFRAITAAFCDHPASIDKSYAEHAGFAASFGMTLIAAGAAAMIHAALPFLCRDTAGNTVMRLHALIQARRASAHHDTAAAPVAAGLRRGRPDGTGPIPA